MIAKKKLGSGVNMTQTNTSSAYDLNGQTQFLGRIYTFLGWLGLIGAGFLLFALFSPQAIPVNGIQTSLFRVSPHLSVFLLICWSTLLLHFAKDVTGPRKWSTGFPGVIVAVINLLSVPVGTAVGIYTLWVLLQYRRLH